MEKYASLAARDPELSAVLLAAEFQRTGQLAALIKRHLGGHEGLQGISSGVTSAIGWLMAPGEVVSPSLALYSIILQVKDVPEIREWGRQAFGSGVEGN